MDMTLLFLSQIAVSDLNVVKFQGVNPQGLYGDLNCLYIPDFK